MGDHANARGGLTVWLVGLVLLAGPAHGSVFGASGGFLMGINSLRMNELTSHLERQGYPVFSTAFVALGGGAHAFLDVMVLGGEAGALFSNSVSNDRYETSFNGAYGFPQVGVILYARRNLIVYPAAGLGAAKLRLKVTDFEGARLGEFTNTSFLGDLALAAEYIFSPEPDRERKMGVIFGFRLGYLFSSATSRWRAGDVGGFVPTAPFPRIGMTGPYFRLYLAGGWLQMEAYEPEF